MIYIWQCLFFNLKLYLIKHYFTLLKMTFVWATMHHVQMKIDCNGDLDFTKTMRIVHDEHWKVKYSLCKKTDVRVFLLAKPFIRSNHLLRFTTNYLPQGLRLSSKLGNGRFEKHWYDQSHFFQELRIILKSRETREKTAGLESVSPGRCGRRLSLDYQLFVIVGIWKLVIFYDNLILIHRLF